MEPGIKSDSDISHETHIQLFLNIYDQVATFS